MLAVFLIWTATASVITSGLFYWDKRAAARGRLRIAERTLLMWSLLGGWPGGWLTGRLVRHKTQKLSFRLRFAGCVVVHLMFTGALFWGPAA